MKTERIRIFLLVMLVALFFLTPMPFSQRQEGTTTVAPSFVASLPKLPKPQKWDGNLLSDFYKWLDKLSESGVIYGYWLPSNIPDIIPRVYAQSSNFGITSTGSTSYPTTPQEVGTTSQSANTQSNQFVLAVPITTSVAGTITQLGQEFGSGNSGNFVLGLYSDNGSGAPLTLLASTASATCSSSSGWQWVSLTTPYYAVAGKYWIAMQNSAGASVYQSSTLFGATDDANRCRPVNRRHIRPADRIAERGGGIGVAVGQLPLGCQEASGGGIGACPFRCLGQVFPENPD